MHQHHNRPTNTQTKLQTRENSPQNNQKTTKSHQLTEPEQNKSHVQQNLKLTPSKK